MPKTIFLAFPPTLLILLACMGGMTDPVEPPSSGTDAVVSPTPTEPEPSAEDAPLVEREVLIVFGSKNAEEAKDWKLAQDGHFSSDESNKSLLTLVESKDVQGLNPGFHIVIAGYCEPGQADEPLGQLKELVSGAYKRTVQVPANSPGCPTIQDPHTRMTGYTLVPDGTGCRIQRVSVRTGRSLGHVGRFTRACPKEWTLSFNTKRDNVVLASGSVWSFGQSQEPQSPLPTLSGGAEVAYWAKGASGDVLTAWANVSAEEKHDAEAEEAWFEFQGKKVPIDDYYSWQMMGGGMLCVKWVYKSKRWEFVKALGIAPGEGTAPPFCTEIEPDDEAIELLSYHNEAYGMHYEPVDETYHATLNQVSPPNTAFGDSDEWSWGLQHEEGEGGFAISTYWLNGAQLTGRAVVFDGKAAHPLEGLKGRVSDFAAIPDADEVYVCTNEGYGVFDSRTGRKRYWKDGACLAIQDMP